MSKLKTLAKDRRIISAVVLTIGVIVGANIDPLTLEQITEFIVSLTI